MNTCVSAAGRNPRKAVKFLLPARIKNSLLNMGAVPFEDDAVTAEKFGEEK